MSFSFGKELVGCEAVISIFRRGLSSHVPVESSFVVSCWSFYGIFAGSDFLSFINSCEVLQI